MQVRARTDWNPESWARAYLDEIDRRIAAGKIMLLEGNVAAHPKQAITPAAFVRDSGVTHNRGRIVQEIVGSVDYGFPGRPGGGSVHDGTVLSIRRRPHGPAIGYMRTRPMPVTPTDPRSQRPALRLLNTPGI